MKSIIPAVFLLFSSSAFAQVVPLNVYQPVTGGDQQLTEYFLEAKSILQAAGAQVITSRDISGTFRFASSFDNWEDYGRVAQSLASNEGWVAFQDKIAGTRVANQTDNLLTNLRAAATTPVTGPGTTTQVTVWEPTTGTMAELIDAAMGSKPIHESAGAAVSYYTGGGRLYYLMSFENMGAWGRNRDTPNPEFQACFQSLTVNGEFGAVVVDRFTATQF